MEDRPKLGDVPEKSGKRKKETAGARRQSEQMHWLRLVGDRQPVIESPPVAADKKIPETLFGFNSDGGPKEKRIGAFVQEISERTNTQPDVLSTDYQVPEVKDLSETAATELDMQTTNQFELPKLGSVEWSAWQRPKIETKSSESTEALQTSTGVGGTEKPPEPPDPPEKSPEPPEGRGPDPLEGSGAGSPPERPPIDQVDSHSEPTPEPLRPDFRSDWEIDARQSVTRSTAEQMPVPTRVVERRRSGLEALNFVGLVAEFFSRRRHDRLIDRKHSREERRIQKEVKELEHRLHHAESRPPERWAPPSETLSQRVVETKPLPWQRVKSVGAPAAPRQPERPAQVNDEAQQLKQRLEALKSPEAHHLRPEEVLHQVEEAAKRKIAVEAIYERRHEVKDEPHGSAPLGGTGGVMDRPQSSPGPKVDPSIYTPRPAPPQLTPDFSASGNQSKLYGSAMRRGFWAALIIIIVIVIILLLK